MALADVTYYWKLDEVSGTRADSVGGRNMTVLSDPGGIDGSCEGKVNKCVFGKDKSNYIVLGTSTFALITGSLSQNFWIQGPKSLWPGLLFFVTGQSDSDYGTWWISGDGRGAQTFAFRTYGATGGGHTLGTTGAPNTNNKWTMITVTYDTSNKEKKIYINGVAYGTGTASHSNALGTGSNKGIYLNMASMPVAANFDELGIWDGYVLTAADITTLYNNSAGLTYPFFSAQALKFRS